MMFHEDMTRACHFKGPKSGLLLVEIPAVLMFADYMFNLFLVR